MPADTYFLNDPWKEVAKARKVVQPEPQAQRPEAPSQTAVESLADILRHSLDRAKREADSIRVDDTFEKYSHIAEFVEETRRSLKLLVDTSGDRTWDSTSIINGLSLLDLISATKLVISKLGRGGSVSGDADWLVSTTPLIRVAFSDYCRLGAELAGLFSDRDAGSDSAS